MLSIGEFARLTGVSVRMLRHYDQLNLLRPQRVDPSSGYRSYSAEQLDRANQLVALKELGFSLEQVGLLLSGGLAAEGVGEMMRERRDLLRAQLDADARRLHAVEARLRLIEKENPMSTFTEKSLPELHVVQLTAHIEEMSQIENDISDMFTRVNAAIEASDAVRTGPGVATYTDVEGGMIAAAAEQVAPGTVPDGLEAATVAAVPRALTVRYEAADLDGIQQAWQSLVSEVESRGLRPIGTCRELYEATPFDGPDAAGWIVDLQQPVA